MKDGTRTWVRHQLKLKGYSLAGLAREVGLSRHAPKLALNKPYPRMERLIAGAIGVTPQEIWPDRYGPDGKPNRKRGKRTQGFEGELYYAVMVRNGSFKGWTLKSAEVGCLEFVRAGAGATVEGVNLHGAGPGWLVDCWCEFVRHARGVV